MGRKKKIRYRRGNFNIIENPITSERDIRHKLSRKDKYFGCLDRECNNMSIQDLDVLLKINNSKYYDRIREIDRQYHSGEIDEKERNYQYRYLVCIQELIRDWLKLKTDLRDNIGVY